MSNNGKEKPTRIFVSRAEKFDRLIEKIFDPNTKPANFTEEEFECLEILVGLPTPCSEDPDERRKKIESLAIKLPTEETLQEIRASLMERDYADKKDLDQELRELLRENNLQILEKHLGLKTPSAETDKGRLETIKAVLNNLKHEKAADEIYQTYYVPSPENIAVRDALENLGLLPRKMPEFF